MTERQLRNAFREIREEFGLKPCLEQVAFHTPGTSRQAKKTDDEKELERQANEILKTAGEKPIHVY